ncbi:MAG: hypothetical protein AABX01_01765 [Candidatus Micrarchaeota archaeon]
MSKTTAKSLEKVILIHPLGRKGVAIDKTAYDAFSKIILGEVGKKPSTYTEMAGIAEKKLKGKFKGSIRWFLEWVKLDLKARGKIVRIANSAPQTYKLGKG